MTTGKYLPQDSSNNATLLDEIVNEIHRISYEKIYVTQTINNKTNLLL